MGAPAHTSYTLQVLIRNTELRPQPNRESKFPGISLTNVSKGIALLVLHERQIFPISMFGLTNVSRSTSRFVIYVLILFNAWTYGCIQHLHLVVSEPPPHSCEHPAPQGVEAIKLA